MTGRTLLLGACSIVAIDQISKYAVIGIQKLYVVNKGVSFGLGQGMNAWIFGMLLLVVLLDALKRGIHFSDVLILAGGLSNMLDRLFYRGVVDWIRISMLWFNIADISITIGVIWILKSSLRTSRS